MLGLKHSITFYTENSLVIAFTYVLNHRLHCHPSATSLVIAGRRIVSAAEVGARVEDTLDVNAGDVRCEDRTYPDVCSLSRPR